MLFRTANWRRYRFTRTLGREVLRVKAIGAPNQTPLSTLNQHLGETAAAAECGRADLRGRRADAGWRWNAHDKRLADAMPLFVATSICHKCDLRATPRCRQHQNGPNGLLCARGIDA